MSLSTDILTKVLCDMDTSVPYSPSDFEEKSAIADLLEAGYIDANVEYDSAGNLTRVVGKRVTLAGRSALEEMRSDVYVLTEEDVRDRQDAVARFYSSQHDFDKTISVTSSGAIALAFSLAGVIGVEKLGAIEWVLLLLSVAMWATVLIFVLSMYNLSVKAHDEYIQEIDKGNRVKAVASNKTSGKLKKANRRGMVIFCLGVFAFSAFMIRVAYVSRNVTPETKGVVIEKTITTNVMYKLTTLLPPPNR